jgi:hypothetical protein
VSRAAAAHGSHRPRGQGAHLHPAPRRAERHAERAGAPRVVGRLADAAAARLVVARFGAALPADGLLADGAAARAAPVDGLAACVAVQMQLRVRGRIGRTAAAGAVPGARGQGAPVAMVRDPGAGKARAGFGGITFAVLVAAGMTAVVLRLVAVVPVRVLTVAMALGVVAETVRELVVVMVRGVAVATVFDPGGTTARGPTVTTGPGVVVMHVSAATPAPAVTLGRGRPQGGRADGNLIVRAGLAQEITRV